MLYLKYLLTQNLEYNLSEIHIVYDNKTNKRRGFLRKKSLKTIFLNVRKLTNKGFKFKTFLMKYELLENKHKSRKDIMPQRRPDLKDNEAREKQSLSRSPKHLSKATHYTVKLTKLVEILLLLRRQNFNFNCYLSWYRSLISFIF